MPSTKRLVHLMTWHVVQRPSKYISYGYKLWTVYTRFALLRSTQVFISKTKFLVLKLSFEIDFLFQLKMQTLFQGKQKLFVLKRFMKLQGSNYLVSTGYYDFYILLVIWNSNYLVTTALTIKVSLVSAIESSSCLSRIRIILHCKKLEIKS